MPNWSDLLREVRSAGSTHDAIRRKYLSELHAVTNRNVIVYYSAWLQKEGLLRQGVGGFDLNDNDKNGFMATVHQLDRAKGLDLVMHTPGGDLAATESIVDYLRSMFDGDVRVIVPQLAMSAGTMIALSASEIIMGKHSSLGPIDPQISGLPAHGIKEEFEQAEADIRRDNLMIALWQPIIAKYHPTLIGEAEKAITWSNEVVEEWLISGMFNGDVDAKAKAQTVIAEFGDHALTKAHARHISMSHAIDAGVKVKALEGDPALQEAVLTVHHACIQTLADTPVIKLIENHLGVAYITAVNVG